MRILGLDIGSKRIGIAMSDELTITAQGMETLQSKGADNDVKRITQIANENNVSEIVIGLPFNMDGSAGPQAEKVREFAAKLATAVNLKIIEWDERLSSVAAERMLIEADVSRSKRHKVIDKVAAVLILQGYLDSKSFKDLSAE